MLDERGVPAETGANGHQDVLVVLSHSTSTTTLVGSLRHSTTYYASTQTSSFSTGSVSVTTGDSIWFISTYQAVSAGDTVYNWQAILNSYNFDYNRPGSVFWPAVNSSHPNEANWYYPFNHVFRSPGRSRNYTTRLRVIEPGRADMTNGITVSDSVVVTVAADSACWTSAGGQVQTTINFSASCSDNRNGNVAEYQWVWGDGSSDSPWNTSTSAAHVYSTSGAKTVKLRIRLNTGEGGMDSTSHTVTITPPPITSLSIEGTNGTLRSNQTCDWGAYHSGGTPPFSHVWSIGGGQVGTGQYLSYAHRKFAFTLRVDVTDSENQTAWTTRSVTLSSSGIVCLF